MVKVCHAEVEARKKWCPFARGNSIARERVSATGEYDNRCIGSACMAWRWEMTHIEDKHNPGGDLVESHDTHGFCGLAGPTPRG